MEFNRIRRHDRRNSSIEWCPPYPFRRHGYRKELLAHDSLLLQLSPADTSKNIGENFTAEPIKTDTLVSAPVVVPIPLEMPFTLSEPNALLLDYAEYAVDDEPWQPEDEILRIDAALRDRFGWDARNGRLCQPYAIPTGEKYEHILRLRFTINCETKVISPMLALERAEDCVVTLNGIRTESAVTGWYTDESIRTISLPSLKIGLNILEISVPVGRRLGAEWCYLLGGFGVRVAGGRTTVIALTRTLSFGDLTVQGLPFYGGNVTYHLKVNALGAIGVTASHFRSPLLAVDIDGSRAGIIAWAPYRLEVPVTPGEHSLNITVFGNRVNTFGCVHNCDKTHFFFSPESWRTEGAAWSREYQIKPFGILVSPMVTSWRHENE